MSENLKQRCISLSPVSYTSNGEDSPSPYCQCIMDGFEIPEEGELIFSNINIPEKVECGTLDPTLVSSGVVCEDGDIPNLSNMIVGRFPPEIDTNISDTYLKSMTNLYNTKLNEDSEILASYIRCKEESYKPIINQFRDNATVITDFVTQNQDSISRILSNGKIDSIINETSDILSAVPASDVKETIDKINTVLDNDNINSVIDKTDDILSAVPTSDITDAMDLVKELTGLFSWWKIGLWIVIILVSIFVLSFIFVKGLSL